MGYVILGYIVFLAIVWGGIPQLFSTFFILFLVCFCFLHFSKDG